MLKQHQRTFDLLAADADHLRQQQFVLARQGGERDDSERCRSRSRRRLARNDSGDGEPGGVALSAADASPIEGNESNMMRVRVCEETYELATSRCPHTRWLEYMSGTQPRRRCSLHPARRSRPRVRRHRRQEQETAGRETATAAQPSPEPTAGIGATPDMPAAETRPGGGNE